MSKRITALSPMLHGHLRVELEDGSSVMLQRGEHENHTLQVGDSWPAEENSIALDQASSQEVAEQRESVVGGPAGQNEARTSPESGDGPREEGQQGPEAQDEHAAVS
jgi:hypothetical protein